MILHDGSPWLIELEIQLFRVCYFTELRRSHYPGFDCYCSGFYVPATTSNAKLPRISVIASTVIRWSRRECESNMFILG